MESKFVFNIFWIILLSCGKGESACPSDSSSKYAKVGEAVKLQYNVDVNAKQYVRYEIVTSAEVKVIGISYLNGVIFSGSSYVINSVNFLGNFSTGNLSFEIPGVKLEDGSVYRLEKNSNTSECITLYVFGVPEKPVITPDNNNVVGLDTILTCSSKSTTQPHSSKLSLHYTWTVDNPDVTRYVSSQNNHTLTIKSLKKTDSGKEFTCTSTESGDGVVGETAASSNVFVLVLIYGPDASTTMLSPDSMSYTRNEGDSLNDITCSGDCYPSCKYSWTKSDDNTLVTNDKALSLAQLTRAEAATYTCTVTNSNRTITAITKTVTVIVTYGPDPSSTKLTPSSTMYTRNEGNSLDDIHCFGNCYPGCDYKWTRLGSNTSVNSATLSLGLLNRIEAGTYTCTVSNPTTGEEQAKTISILVRYGPNECKFSLSSPLTLAEGETSPTISCSSECYPPCSYTWRNVSAGTVIGANGKFQLVKATRHQAGHYECTCRNKATEYAKTHTSTLQIAVQYTSFFVEGNEGRDEITVDEYNEDVRFKCLITSKWESAVKIMFQGVVLKEQFQTRSVSFSYNSITCLHAGTYTCEGDNQHGKVPSSTIKVFVRCSPRPLRQTNQNFTGSLYESAKLNISTLAYPEPGPSGFLWYKEIGMRWIPLRSNTDLLISSSGSNSNLTIKNVSQQDYGQYRVTVTNVIGSYEHYLFLVDKKYEQKKEITTETDKTGLICLGILSAVLTIYSTFITIALKRKISNTGTESKEESTKQATYINVAEGGTSRNDSGSSGNKDNSIELYTDLARSSVDDKTTYDIIQRI